MKKLLLTCSALVVIALSSILAMRFNANRTNITPYPFYFNSEFKQIKSEAPILIIGDRMALRLASFKDQLAEKISGPSNSKVKIQVLAEQGQNIHRTLHKLKKLDRLPLIIILLNNTDENYEELFYSKDRTKILQNFELYDDLSLQTLLIIFPTLSRLLYNNVDYKQLPPQIAENQNTYPDHTLLRRKEIHFKLYEATLNNLLNYTKKQTSFILPVTTPLNLSTPPKKNCYGTLADEATEDLNKIKQLIKKKDYKSAYNISKDLVLIYPNHAELLFLHGRVLAKLNQFARAKSYSELAIAFDCGNQFGHPIYNSIMIKTAKQQGIAVFDFHKFLSDESSRNFTFIDEIYPQDLYLNKLTDILALKIQNLLKLDP